jgi:hypothetical protein
MFICMKVDSDGLVTEAEVHDPGDETAVLRVTEAYTRLIDCIAPSSPGRGR